MFSSHIGYAGSSSMRITGVQTLVASKFSFITLRVVLDRHRLSVNVVRGRLRLHQQVHFVSQGNGNTSKRSNRVGHNPLPTNVHSGKCQVSERCTADSGSFNRNSSLIFRLHDNRHRPFTLDILMFSGVIIEDTFRALLGC